MCETSQNQAPGTAATASTSGSVEQECARDLLGPEPRNCGHCERLRLQGFEVLTSDAAEQVCETSQDQAPGTAATASDFYPPWAVVVTFG